MDFADVFPCPPDAGGPVVEFLAPRPFSTVASGLSTPQQPSPAGMFFTIDVRVTTRIAGVVMREGPIASPGSIPGPNPNVPTFVFVFDTDFITPSGVVIPACTNLAPLFQFAGSELAPGGGVSTTLTWFVGGSVPQTVTRLVMGAAITDVAGKRGQSTLGVFVLPGTTGSQFTPDPPPPPAP